MDLSLKSDGPYKSAEEDIDWRKKCKNSIERNRFLLNNQVMSDVTFIVGSFKTKVYAHKLILSSASTVFETMFQSEWITNEDINVIDIESDTFMDMLRFIYLDEIDVNKSNVFDLLYGSRKYLLHHLITACLDLIKTKSKECIFHESFLDIDSDALSLILDLDEMSLKEIDLFNRVDSWLAMECERKGLKVDGENKRLILGKDLLKIRFPSMSMKEFTNGPANSFILTKDEMIGIFSYFNLDTKPGILFNHQIRSKTVQALLPDKLGHVNVKNNPCLYRETLTFHMSGDVVLKGLILGSALQNITIRVEIKGPGFWIEGAYLFKETRAIPCSEKIDRFMFEMNDRILLKGKTLYDVTVTRIDPMGIDSRKYIKFHHILCPKREYCTKNEKTGIITVFQAGGDRKGLIFGISYSPL